jgi:hypothetical protein
MRNLLEKNVHRWLSGYLRHLGRRAFRRDEARHRHVLFAICDHYEPFWRNADERIAHERVRRWVNDYPAYGRYRDADGRMPQHTWFFPGEDYRPECLADLAELVSQEAGEVELHLHHDHDTEQELEHKIERYLELFAQHGHLARTSQGNLRYAFVHGNWALANGRPDGRWCGVDAELDVLFRTGCYADFTFPSCPDVTQPRVVNAIYWPTGDLRRRRAYDSGSLARVGACYEDRILLVTGPLAVVRRAHTWRPRLEYGAIQPENPPNAPRIRTWVSQHIHVGGRPEWVFVKVYTHGAWEEQADSFFGAGGNALHDVLTTTYNDGERWSLHYVTAREMFNIARAAMAGMVGNPGDYRDFVLPPPPARTAHG